MRIAAAQSISAAADLGANAEAHAEMIRIAGEAGAALLVFPELSLSGYELALMARCAVAPDDDLLAPLREAARRSGVVAVVGAPLTNPQGKPFIGAIALFPDGRTSVYRKQHLHGGEDVFAAPGPPDAHRLALGGEAIALAICADTVHPEHARAAAESGASLYAAGVLVTEDGYGNDSAMWRSYAAARGMGVLVANHGAPSGGYVSAGRSAFWAPGGELVAAVEGTGSALLLAEKRAGSWRGSVQRLSRTPGG